LATLNQALGELPEKITSHSHDEVWQYLGKLANRVNTAQPNSPVTAGDLLFRAVDVTKANDPRGTLEIIRYAQARGLDKSQMQAVACTCLDRLGEHTAAKQATIALVDDESADAESKLVAANLLVRYGEQERALKAALSAYDALGKPLRHTATVLYITQRCADFYRNAELTRQITDAYLSGNLALVNEAPRTNLLWSSDPKMNIEVTSLWAKNNLPKDKLYYEGTRPSLDGRRLKVGYLSSDFREHPTLRLMMGALRHHDASRFEIILICSGWDDDSPIRQEAVALCSRVIPVAHLSDSKAAEVIKDEGIDVLVELNGPTRANRIPILTYRPAPVQIDYLGWAGSIGGVGADYIIGDNWTIPPGAEKDYPECVMRMDPTYQINDHANYAGVNPPSREDVNLPDDMVVLGAFNAVNKIQGDVWRVWMEILKAAPHTVLWILDPGDAARRRLAKYAAHYGVDIKRIIGAPAMLQAAHLNRIAAADLMIDPWPYGGHTSTSDALYAGVPVVTINGTNYPGRVSAGLLRAAGLPELVAKDPQDYADKILKLVSNKDLLAQYKEALTTANQTTAFNAATRTRQLEELYLAAYSQWENRLRPKHLSATNTLQPQARLVPGLPVTVESANTGYGSNPEWIRTGAKPPLKPNSARIAVAAEKPKAVVVLGPWSSGTSAVAQVVDALGAKLVGSMLGVNDPKTQTYEMAAFRSLLLTLADEQNVVRIANADTARVAIGGFANDYARPGQAPLLLKHGLAAFFLPELEAAFDVKIIAVLRPLADIERSRERRRWPPQFGRTGAEKIYATMNDALAASKSPVHWVKYNDLREQPTATVGQLAGFLALDTSEKALLEAVSRVRK